MLLLGSRASADFNPRDWKHFRLINQPAASDPQGYASIVLDQATFGAASPSLSDLRLADAAGREVPYRLNVSRSEAGNVQVAGVVMDVSHAANVSSFVLSILPGRPSQHNQVTLRTGETNFRATVKIEASDDRQNWGTIRENAAIFDVTADYKAAHLVVDYPTSTRRFLRVSVTNEKPSALRIDGASTSQRSVSNALETRWEESQFGHDTDGGRTTVWVVDLRYDNLPVSRIEILAGDNNIQRPVRVLAIDKSPEGIERRTVLMSGVIWRFALPGVVSENFSIGGGEFRKRRFNIEVDNGDNPPLAVSEIRFFGPKHTLSFPVNRPWPYRLYSGNPDAAAPVYDLAAFSGYLDLANAPMATPVGIPEQNPGYQQVDKRPWTEKHQKIFWASLVMLCGFLIAMIVQKTREILKT